MAFNEKRRPASKVWVERTAKEEKMNGMDVIFELLFLSLVASGGGRGEVSEMTGCYCCYFYYYYSNWKKRIDRRAKENWRRSWR
jgi:hypothetical protein